eukprot:g20152.t1
MAKTLDYQITLYPAHRDGAFVVTQFQMLANYPEKRIEAAGMDDLIDQVTQFAMEHGESCSASMLEAQRRAAEQRVETRAALLTELRGLGVTGLDVQYEGYGDSGNVEEVVVTPDTITLTEELRRRVEDFGWDFAYALSPGFENNEGGYGELTWALETDKIDVGYVYVTLEAVRKEFGVKRVTKALREQAVDILRAPALPDAPRFAQNLMQAAKILVPVFEAGRSIDAAALRAAMEDACGASDTSGAWVWKDAYEAAEVAQILILSRYGALMQRQALSPQAFLTMIERFTALAPSHTRRSEDSIRLQQFSTPLPLAAIVAQAAGFRDDDLMLEPSTGTGMLAIFAKIAGARLALNELADTRRALLGQLFPDAAVSDHDAASIDDRLDRSITPSVVVMNPPFSAANHVEGRFRQATSQHVLSALARLAPGGRLVVITGESFRPSLKSFQSTFQRIGQSADVVFSAPIDGKVFARHGTTIDTRLTVIDKRAAGAEETAPADIDAAYHPICATTSDLLSVVLAHCPERRSPPPCPTTSALSVPSQPTRTNLHALRNAARKETRALAEERAKHPFDDIETAPLDYLPKAWSEPYGTLQDTVYEVYDLQAIRIDGAAEHPTALVQSAAMASVPPPVPSYRPAN